MFSNEELHKTVPHFYLYKIPYLFIAISVIIIWQNFKMYQCVSLKRYRVLEGVF